MKDIKIPEITTIRITLFGGPDDGQEVLATGHSDTDIKAMPRLDEKQGVWRQAVYKMKTPTRYEFTGEILITKAERVE